MRRKTPSAKQGQVLLETVIVLISLATFAVVSLRIFSNLNLNMTARITKYRQTRSSAINQGGDIPLDYFSYYPYTGPIGTGFSSGFALIFLEDPYIAEAARLLEQENDIIDVIMPYKINQAHDLAQSVNCVLDGAQWTDNNGWWGFYNSITWHNYQFVDLVKGLVGDSGALANNAYVGFGSAINSFVQALGYTPLPVDQLDDTPLPASDFKTIIESELLPAVPAGSLVLLNPGPFNPEPTLAMYGLTDTARLEAIKKQNQNNREQIKRTIISLHKAYRQGLSLLIKGNDKIKEVPQPSHTDALPYDDRGNKREKYDYFVAYVASQQARSGLAKSLGQDPNSVVETIGKATTVFQIAGWYSWYELDQRQHQSAREKLNLMRSYVGQLDLGQEPAPNGTHASVTLDADTKGRIRNIYTNIYGNSSTPQDIDNLSLTTVLSAKDDARAIAGAFNTLALSQLKDYADELGDSLEQAIVRWNDSSPPQVGSFIYTRQGRGKVLSVDTAAQTVTVERQLKVGEKVCVPGGGQGTITSVNNSGDTATIELLGIEYREGTTPPVQPSPAIIRVGDWVYPRLQEGDIVRTTRRDWKCLVGSYLPPTLTPFAPARATIVLQERTFLEYYVALRDNMLRHAQSVIRLISNLTASDDLTILERVVFSRYLSDRFAELYYSLPDEGGALFGDRIKVQLAWNILRPLTKDSVDDAFFNAELVDKHRILNGVAERLKNRLDRVLKDWENEDKLIIALHNLNPARFPFENRAEIQRLIFRIKGVSSQETLGAILKEQERLSDKEIQNVLEIQAIQVRRTQLLRSMHLDSWTLYKVTDCHYDRDTEPKQIVVRPAS